jgi:hypothetical protein
MDGFGAAAGLRNQAPRWADAAALARQWRPAQLAERLAAMR